MGFEYSDIFELFKKRYLIYAQRMRRNQTNQIEINQFVAN